MTRQTFLAAIILVFLSTNVHAEGLSIFAKKGETQSTNTEGLSQLHAVSINLLPVGIKHPGVGVSFDFERYLGHYIAVDCNAGAGLFYARWFDFSDFTTDITAGVNLRAYPFYEALRGFYAGFGAGCDGVFYLGKNYVPADAQKFFFYIKPEIGWKFYILDHFMIDCSVDYRKRFILTPNNLPKFYSDVLSEGFHVGVGFKFYYGN